MSLKRPIKWPVKRPLTRAIGEAGGGGGFDSIMGNTLADYVTFSRASTATYFDSVGVLQTAAIDAPRYEYDPATLEYSGLLVEGPRTNLWTRSAEFNQAVWAKSAGTTITANAGVAPDGTMTADKIIGAAGSGSRFIRQDAVLTAATYTVSVFAKAAEASWLAFVDAIPNASCYFNLGDGSLGSVFNATHAIEDCGNGWYRCSMTYTGTAATHSPRIYVVSGDGSLAFVGDGVAGILIWGAQIELGGFASSHIPTAATSLARSADLPAADLSAFDFNATEGTFYVEGVQAAAFNGPILAIDDETAANFMRLEISSLTPRAVVSASSVTQLDISGGSPQPSGVTMKAALAYKANDAAAAFNGTATSDNTFTVPAVTKLAIGHDPVGGGHYYGHVRRVRAYRTRRSNGAMEAETDNAALPLFGLTVAFIGDSLIERGDYPERVAASTGCNSLSFGIGGTRMGLHQNADYNELCGYKLADAINTGDFTAAQTAAANLAAGGDDNTAQVNAMAAQDWSAVDVVVIQYGTNDYRESRPIGTTGSVTADGSTYIGSANYIAQQLLAAYPHLQLVWIAPLFRLIPNTPLDPDENSDNAPNLNGDFLIEYGDALIAETSPVYDAYRLSGINLSNWETYIDDGVHLSEPAGCVLFSEKVGEFLRENYESYQRA